MSVNKNEPEEWEYCPNCDKHVLGHYTTNACIGQYGTNVELRVYCPDCDKLIRSKLIDKDI